MIEKERIDHISKWLEDDIHPMSTREEVIATFNTLNLNRIANALERIATAQERMASMEADWLVSEGIYRE